MKNYQIKCMLPEALKDDQYNIQEIKNILLDSVDFYLNDSKIFNTKFTSSFSTITFNNQIGVQLNISLNKIIDKDKLFWIISNNLTFNYKDKYFHIKSDRMDEINFDDFIEVN